MSSGLGAAWPVALPATVPERKELYTRLVGWRKAAKALNIGYKLRLGKSFSGDPSHAFVQQLENAAPATRNPNAKPCLPCCAHVVGLEYRRNPFPDTASEDNIVKIVDRLQVERGSNSQVYIGELADVKVVVKIYQWSWIEDPAFDFLNKDEVCEKEEESALWGFVTEQWAYERMRPIHGMAVPHLYGFFEVELPHGEPCIAMVGEYIEPPNPKKPVYYRKGDLEVIGMRLFLALHAVHSCDIYLQDTSYENMIVPKERLTGHVFIDFGNCTALKSKKPHYGIRKICGLLDSRFEKSSVRAWIRRMLKGDDACCVHRRAMFDLPDDPKKLARTLKRLLKFKDGDAEESGEDEKEEEEEDGMVDVDVEEDEEGGDEEDEEDKEDGDKEDGEDVDKEKEDGTGDDDEMVVN